MAGRTLNIKLSAGAVGALAATVVVGLAANVGASSKSPSGLPRGSDPVNLDPADFSANIDNRRWPMTVGSRWIYRVTDPDGTKQRQVITVTHETKMIADGIEARVVSDVVRDHGKPVEVTKDWYAQDSDGNVWYFGEDTVEYKH